jgi:replication factor C subunit 2/4
MSDGRAFDLRYTQLPWTEKHRSYKLDDIFIPMTIKNKLKDIIATKNMPNIILSGPPGIGKSSAIKAVALDLYGKYYNDAVLELNLLDDRGIDFMRSDILLFCKTKISYKGNDEKKYPKYKLIVFDEADSIIKRVQDQISNIIEKFGDTIRFAFTCNSSSEICEVIQTKSFIWWYSYLENDLVVDKLKDICTKEKVKFTENALNKIATLSRGDVRNAINKLQMLYSKYNQIKEEYVDELCDTPQEVIIKQIFMDIINNDFKKALSVTLDLKKNSYSGSDIMLGMLATIRSDICDDISDDIKNKLCSSICSGTYQISNVTDNDLQLTGCIVDMIRAVNK